jgi:hypothetical protein
MKAHNRKMVPKLTWGLVRTVTSHLNKCVLLTHRRTVVAVVNPNKQNPKSVLINESLSLQPQRFQVTCQTLCLVSAWCVCAPGVFTNRW